MGFSSGGGDLEYYDDICHHANIPLFVVYNQTTDSTSPQVHSACLTSLVVVSILTLAQVSLVAVPIHPGDINTMAESLSDFVKTGRIDYVIEYLRTHAGSVGEQNPRDGTTALYWAACIGDPDMCNILLQHGAEVNKSACQWGSKPLHVAADRGRDTCAELFLKWGADVNARSHNTLYTALHNAAYRGHYELCHLLVCHGADVTLYNRDGKTASEEAQAMTHHTTYKYLLEKERKAVEALSDPRKAMSADLRHSNRKPSHLPLNKTLPIGNGLTSGTHHNGSSGNTHHNGLGELVSTDAIRQETDINVKLSKNVGIDDVPLICFNDEFGVVEISRDVDDVQRSQVVVVNNNDAPSLHQDCKYQQQTLTNKLRSLEIFIEKLQMALAKYREHVTQLSSENERLKQVTSCTCDLETQLSAARSEITRQFHRQQLDETKLSELRRQVTDMNTTYEALKREYSALVLMYKTHSKPRTYEDQENLSSDDNWQLNNVCGESGYDGDSENSRIGVGIRLSSRGLGDGSTSSSGTSSPGSDSPTCGNRTTGKMTSYPKPTVTATSTTTTTTKASSYECIGAAAAVPPPCEQTTQQQFLTQDVQTSGSACASTTGQVRPSTQQLISAVSPVYTLQGREFMDMLSASLLYQIKSSSESPHKESLSLDTAGKVWIPGHDFSFDPDVRPWISNADEKEIPTSVLCGIIRQDRKMIMKMTSLNNDDQQPTSPGKEELLRLQSLYSSAGHVNVSRILHCFTANLSTSMCLPLPQTVMIDLQTAAYSITETFPDNLYYFLKKLKSNHTSAAEVLPERFVLHVLYGLLSAVDFLHGVGIVHGDLSTANVALTSSLRPVLEHSDLGIRITDDSNADIVITERTQLLRHFNRRVPPEIAEARTRWKDTLQNKTTLRQLFGPGEMFCLGAMVLSMLRSGWQRISTSASSDVLSASSDVLSAFSANLRTLLCNMTQQNPGLRPTPAHAKIITGILLYGPAKNEVTSFTECQIWHHTRMMTLLMPCSRCNLPQESTMCSDDVRRITNSIPPNDAILEKDFLTSVTAAELWEVYKTLDLHPPA